MIVGASGSGKTTLARALLQQMKVPRILVIDPKCTYGGSTGEAGYELVRTPGELRRLSRRATRMQYRPDIEYQNSKGYDTVYEWCFRQGNMMVYTDETFQTMQGTKAPDWQRACITCGRELGVQMIFATQRPKGVDPRIMTEAESHACFHLRKVDDRKTMAETMGDQVLVIPPRFAFWFCRDGMREPRLAKLNLAGGG